MSKRLISPLKRPNSENLWFRIIVPSDLRALAGKREIRGSLHTPSMAEARLLCAAKQVEWNERFDQMRAAATQGAAEDGRRIVDKHLDAQIAKYGTFHAIAYELEQIAQAECAHLDDPAMLEAEEAAVGLCPGYAQYTTPHIDGIIAARQRVLHRDAATAPLAGTEAAVRARDAGFWQIARSFLEDAFAAAGVPLDGAEPKVRIAADHFLARLLSYRLPQIDAAAVAHPVPQALQPVPARSEPTFAASHQQFADAKSNSSHEISERRRRIMGEHAGARTILEVFAAWSESRPPEDAKLVDEWRTSINRFVELHGDVDVALINKDMVKEYKEALKGLPPRPNAEIRCLPLLDQIEIARRDALPTLSGPTVVKNMGGLRAVLNHAIDPLGLIEENVAYSVKLIGAKSAVDVRKAHTPEELGTIFSSPMMVDPGDRLRTTDFWLILLAPLMGVRIEESAKLRPGNIKVDRDIHYISIERDSRKKRREDKAEGKVAKRAKTIASYRDIPVHWILLEAGFIDFVERRRATGDEWLFSDLTANKYGHRSKAASQRIIRSLRRLGIKDEEKVFHSFRHDMKRAARGTPMKEEISDLLAGHAPDTVGRKYGAGAELDVLQNALNMIDYPLVEWDPVIAAAKARTVRDAG